MKSMLVKEIIFRELQNDYGMSKFICEHGKYTLSYIKHPLGHVLYFIGNASQTCTASGITENTGEASDRLLALLNLFLEFDNSP